MAYNPLSKIGSHKSTLKYTKINLKLKGEKRRHFLSRMATKKYRVGQKWAYSCQYAKQFLLLSFFLMKNCKHTFVPPCRERMIKLGNPFGKYYGPYSKKKLSVAF